MPLHNSRKLAFATKLNKVFRIRGHGLIQANNSYSWQSSSLSLSVRQVASAKQRFLSHRLFVENLLSGFELCIPIIIILTYQYTKSDICFSFSKNRY